MPELEWHEAIDEIRPYVVRITTPSGSGTGFLFAYLQSNKFCAIATAAHVIAHPHAWQQPIRIRHLASGHTVLTQPATRTIRIEQTLDTATLIIPRGDIPFPKELLPLIPKGKHLRVGVEVGWVGFPSVSPESLCLFSGRISCWLSQEGAYLVDGVAINGVSGGPAFNLGPATGLRVVGILSAYIPNLATGEPLPGLSVVRDVSLQQKHAEMFKNLDDAKQKETPPATVEPSDPAGATRSER